MTKRSTKGYWKNYRYKKEILSFLPFFILFWYWFYQIPYKNIDTKEYEHSFFMSGFVAAFPAVILSSMVTLFITSRTSKWLKPMMKLIVIVARIDGKISVKDEKIIEKNLNNHYSYFRVKKAIRYFYEFEKKDSNNIAEPCKELTEIFAAKDMTILLGLLINISLSDQYLSLKEENILKSITQKLGVSLNSLELILSRKDYISEANEKRKKYRKPFVSSSNSSYKELGLTNSATLDEVKKAYRELAKIYHPDKVRDKKLKTNAKKQFQAITDAYETIKKEKG